MMIESPTHGQTAITIMKYVGLLSGGKDSCFNLLHCQRNGHELVAAASLGPPNGKGSASFIASVRLNLEA